jgi:hypothetical protein
MNQRCRFIFIILFVAVNGCKKNYPQPETPQAGNNKWVVTTFAVAKSVFNNNQNAKIKWAVIIVQISFTLFYSGFGM